MRLAEYSQGRRRPQRIALTVSRRFGAELDDVAKVSMRRPEFFGRPFLALAQTVLRGSATWSDGELELFAAVVSEANSCPFCVGTHGEIAGSALEGRFDNWRNGGFGARTTVTAEFVAAVARGAADAGHVERARAAGVDDAALAEAAYVSVVFNTINRLANALDFTYRSERDRLRGARILRRNGYRLPRFLLR
jgi:alkylhydroperoxidase family enzyme